jgi:hypothetical protein
MFSRQFGDDGGAAFATDVTFSKNSTDNFVSVTDIMFANED